MVLWRETISGVDEVKRMDLGCGLGKGARKIFGYHNEYQFRRLLPFVILKD